MAHYAAHWLESKTPRSTLPAKGRGRGTADVILELLGRPEYRDRGCSWGTLELEIDSSGSTILFHLHRLREAGYVEHERKGAPYVITSAGLAQLDEVR